MQPPKYSIHRITTPFLTDFCRLISSGVLLVLVRGCLFPLLRLHRGFQPLTELINGFFFSRFLMNFRKLNRLSADIRLLFRRFFPVLPADPGLNLLFRWHPDGFFRLRTADCAEMPVLAGQAVVLRLLRVIIQKRILFSFSVFRVLVLTECFLSGKNLGNDLDLVIVFVILKLQVFASRVIRKIEKQLEPGRQPEREPLLPPA